MQTNFPDWSKNENLLEPLPKWDHFALSACATTFGKHTDEHEQFIPS